MEAIIYAAEIGFLGAVFLTSAVMSFSLIAIALYLTAMGLATATAYVAYYLTVPFRRS